MLKNIDEWLKLTCTKQIQRCLTVEWRTRIFHCYIPIYIRTVLKNAPESCMDVKYITNSFNLIFIQIQAHCMLF